MARPRAGDWLEDEIGNWRRQGVQAVVRLLEAHEVADLELSREAALCRDGGMDFVEFPIPDRGTPEVEADCRALVAILAERLKDGHAVAVHCRAGIGRSSLIAACVMTMLGCRADAAFEAIKAARGLPVPDTDDQRRWVEAFARHLTPR